MTGLSQLRPPFEVLPLLFGNPKLLFSFPGTFEEPLVGQNFSKLLPAINTLDEISNIAPDVMVDIVERLPALLRANEKVADVLPAIATEPPIILREHADFAIDVGRLLDVVTAEIAGNDAFVAFLPKLTGYMSDLLAAVPNIVDFLGDILSPHNDFDKILPDLLPVLLDPANGLTDVLPTLLSPEGELFSLLPILLNPASGFIAFLPTLLDPETGRQPLVQDLLELLPELFDPDLGIVDNQDEWLPLLLDILKANFPEELAAQADTVPDLPTTSADTFQMVESEVVDLDIYEPLEMKPTDEIADVPGTVEMLPAQFDDFLIPPHEYHFAFS